MKFKQNLLKNINSIAVGFGLFGFTAFTDAAKASAPPKCTAAISSKVDGKYTKTAAQIGNAMTFCTDTPERFEITIHELGLCTSQPIQTGSPRTFSKNDCVVSMTSSGVTADLANSTVDLPPMKGRPPSQTYTHAYIIITNTFGLKGSVTIKNGSGDDVKYCSLDDSINIFFLVKKEKSNFCPVVKFASAAVRELILYLLHPCSQQGRTR